MVKYIQGSGTIKLGLKKVMVYKFGQMDQNMKDSGIMIWHVDMEDLFLLMVMFTKVIGLMIKLMATVNISTQKEQHTKVGGMKINKKDQDERNGLMVRFMKEFT